MSQSVHIGHLIPILDIVSWPNHFEGNKVDFSQGMAANRGLNMHLFNSCCLCGWCRSFCPCLIEPFPRSPELRELIEVNHEFQVQLWRLPWCKISTAFCCCNPAVRLCLHVTCVFRGDSRSCWTASVSSRTTLLWCCSPSWSTPTLHACRCVRKKNKQLI